MFFVVVGVVLGAPTVFHVANRWLEEVIIPKQELTKLKKRRAQQAATGVPEEERETTHHVTITFHQEGLACDLEITNEEHGQMFDAGTLDVMRRGANRRPHIKRAEEAQREQA